MTASQLLDVEDLKVYYKTLNGAVRAVDGTNFKVEKNEIFGLAGESGCGKSTLARSILRLINPPCYIEGGKIIFKDVNLLGLEDESLRKIRGRRISYIPQSSMNALNPVMRIEDQIVDTILAHGDTPKEEAKDKAAELFKTVGLPERCATMYPHELSGGMRQRTVICIGIALKPELIIADEPTTALDVVIQRGVLQAIANIKKTLSASIILVSHDMAVQAEITDREAIMYAGKIMEIGTTHTIFEEPLHPYTKALISAIPSVEEKKTLKSLSGRPPSLSDPPPGCRFHPRCAFTMEKCKVEEPLLSEISPGHRVNCHLYKT